MARKNSEIMPSLPMDKFKLKLKLINWHFFTEKHSSSVKDDWILEGTVNSRFKKDFGSGQKVS